MEVNQQTIEERATKLGRAIGQSDRIKALERAEKNIKEDEDASEKYNRLQELQEEAFSVLKEGGEVSDEKGKEIQELSQELEKKAEFQQLIAAKTNFNNLLQQVNQFIQQGISEGQDSKIIEI